MGFLRSKEFFLLVVLRKSGFGLWEDFEFGSFIPALAVATKAKIIPNASIISFCKAKKELLKLSIEVNIDATSERINSMQMLRCKSIAFITFCLASQLTTYEDVVFEFEGQKNSAAFYNRRPNQHANCWWEPQIGINLDRISDSHFVVQVRCF